jgi:AraC-like DNA-binding protein
VTRHEPCDPAERTGLTQPADPAAHGLVASDILLPAPTGEDPRHVIRRVFLKAPDLGILTPQPRGDDDTVLSRLARGLADALPSCPPPHRMWSLGKVAVAMTRLDRPGLPLPLVERRAGSWLILLSRPLPEWLRDSSGAEGEVLALLVGEDDLPGLGSDEGMSRPKMAVSSGVWRLIAGLVDALRPLLPLLTIREAEAAGESILMLLAASVAATPLPDMRTPETRLQEPRTCEHRVLERARQIVRSHGGDVGFGPVELGRHLGLSRSNLYRRFQSQGGVARFIQQERLEEARRRLIDPDRDEPIHAIGLAVGFPDHSTFSRAFRRAFGISPSECRDKALRDI